jgi:hypothetical protein
MEVILETIYIIGAVCCYIILLIDYFWIGNKIIYFKSPGDDFVAGAILSMEWLILVLIAVALLSREGINWLFRHYNYKR